VGISIVAGVYLIMSVVAFTFYWHDKRQAVRGGWRTSERLLHALELLGGWPGSWVGQEVFRHKRSKRGYMVVFWAIVAAHGCGWAWWLLSR
jgi:uncharacterized membrane protein YsdA (DUF1294 family)